VTASNSPRGTSGPLHGTRILDLSWSAAAPYATMLLGDLGADIIKVENALRSDTARLAGFSRAAGTTPTYLALNRNKRNVSLDLKTPGGQDVFARLVESADVLVESFRPGTLARLGFDDAWLGELNPRLIVCSVTGFGLTGPWSDRRGNDPIAQAIGGLIALNGPGDGTDTCFPVGFVVSDLVAGLNACTAVLAALLGRAADQKHELTHIDVSLLSSTVSLLSIEASAYLNAGVVPRPHGGAFFEIFPFESFPTADGHMLVMAAGPQWQILCRAIGLDDLAEDEEFADDRIRFARKHEIRPRLQEAFRRDTTEAWMVRLGEAGIVPTQVLSMDEVFEHPQVKHLGLQVETEGGTEPVKLADSPWQFSNWHKPRNSPPRLGEHTSEVLSELGYSSAEIEQLQNDAAVFAESTERQESA
jgi:crotonobetainyl-CoA:carnitine CoA-transferase CaiB-like acyl-CoA transferase